MSVPWDSRWRQIIGFSSYWISQYGQVFNMIRGELVRPYINNHGIKCVHMYDTRTGHQRGTSRSLRKLVEKHWSDNEYQA
jgi:hypothetical protein